MKQNMISYIICVSEKMFNEVLPIADGAIDDVAIVRSDARLHGHLVARVPTARRDTRKVETVIALTRRSHPGSR